MITYDVNHGSYHTKIIRVGDHLATGIREMSDDPLSFNVFPNPFRTETEIKQEYKTTKVLKNEHDASMDCGKLPEVFVNYQRITSGDAEGRAPRADVYGARGSLP